MFEKLKNMKWGYLIAGILVSVIGFCFLFFSNSLTALTVTVGIILIFCGLATGSLCILRKNQGFAFTLKIALASVLLVGGVLVSAFNKSSFEILVSAICLLTIVDASFKLHISIKSKIYSIDGWWIITAISSAVIISAFLLMQITPTSLKASAIWLGVTMLADAADNFISTFWSAKCKTAEKAAIYYEVYRDIENTKK